MNTGLPDDADARKRIPLATGVIDYFPDALVEVARCSFAGNEQHNPGTPLHWDRSKSGDESDALMRHFLGRGTLDKDGLRHSAKVAWRALANLQKEIEADREAALGEPPANVIPFPTAATAAEPSRTTTTSLAGAVPPVTIEGHPWHSTVTLEP